MASCLTQVTRRGGPLTALLLCAVGILWGQSLKLPTRSDEYASVQKRLSRGWNTWDVNSVMTQVLLPEGLAIQIGTTVADEAFLSSALIGRLTPGAEQIFPGPHAYHGSYTDLRASWRGHNFRIQSAHDGSDLVLLAAPLPSAHPSSAPPVIVFSAALLWNRQGSVTKRDGRIDTHAPSGDVAVYLVGQDDVRTGVPVNGAYFASIFDRPVAISSGKPRTMQEIQSILHRERATYDVSNIRNGQPSQVADAIQTIIGWDTIFDPEHNRVITPVSRNWSVGWGGYVLFDWDTFFTASLAAVGDRDLGYANAIEVLREITPAGLRSQFCASWRLEEL